MKFVQGDRDRYSFKVNVREKHIYSINIFKTKHNWKSNRLKLKTHC